MIFKVQRVLFLAFYTVTMMVLSLPLVQGILALFPGSIYPLIVALLFYMTGVVVLGSLLNTLQIIPGRLAGAFDPIKNGIASGQIGSVEEFSRQITRFTVAFFNFAFLDVDHAFLHTPQAGAVSHEPLSAPGEAMESFGMLEKSRHLTGVERAGKVAHDGSEYHLYVLPLRFGDQWLGYLGLLSRKRIGRIFWPYLEQFEDHFLDDQLMHLVKPRP